MPKGSKLTCVVCLTPIPDFRYLCPACMRSFDRYNRKDSTHAGLIHWAAQRARAAERKRLRAKKA